jgi:hypothetical protein
MAPHLFDKIITKITSTHVGEEISEGDTA